MAPTALSQALTAMPFRIGVVQPDSDVHSALMRRNLEHPNHTQQVTLGIIAAYVVVIAILWNVPYIKMVLWPFKVCSHLTILPLPFLATQARHVLSTLMKLHCTNTIAL
jgi:hypothetical protein